MQLPLDVDAGRREPLHAQIFEQIRSRILDGTLRANARLPASRALAADLAVSRNTVTLAYERLVAEGYLQMRGPLGTFVCDDPACDGLDVAVSPAPRPQQCTLPLRDPSLAFDGCAHTVVPPHGEPLPYDFWVGRLDARLFSTRHWQRLLARTIFEMPIGNSLYAAPAGVPALREVVAQHVGAARGIAARAKDVLIVNGIQEALNIAARLFLRRGRRVAIENPAYLGAANVFASYGARLMPVDVDAHGIDPERLPAQASLLYVTPSHQYPTGATLPLERREHLRHWAERNDAWIVEDDYDSDFHHGGAPLPALKARDDAQRVLYCGTFSKSLGGGLRIGYMVLPPQLMPAATTIKALLNNACAWHPQALLAEFLASGDFLHHLRRMRAVHAARRDALLAALRRHFGAVETTGAQSGMHLVWRLSPELPEARVLCERARTRGVGLYDFDTANVYLADASTRGRYARAIALGYAALDEHEIDVAVGRIAEAARQPQQHFATSQATG